MRTRVLAVVALIMFGACLPARGDGSGSVDVSSSVSTLSSRSNAYGPWIYERADVQLPPKGTIGIHFENRRASDRFNPNTEQYASIDTYQPLSHRVTLYGALAYGSGAPYPRDRFTAELDANAGKGLVFAGGGSFGSGYGVGSTQQLYAAVYYYFGDDYLAFRYTPSWSSVLGSTQGYQMTLSLGHPGKTVEVFRAGTGGEYDISLVSPVNPTLIGEREFGASVSVKHWTSARSGFHIDLDFGSLNRVGGDRIYSRSGVGAGFFFGLP